LSFVDVSRARVVRESSPSIGTNHLSHDAIEGGFQAPTEKTQAMEVTRTTIGRPVTATEEKDVPCNDAAGSTIDWEHDDDDLSSVFSAPFVPLDHDHDDSSLEEEEECFHAQLEELERELRARLEFIETVPSPLRPSLLRRELWSSRLQREALRSASNESVTDTQPNGPALPASADPTLHPWYRRVYEDSLLECYTSLPAAISLFCHCSAMIAIYDLLLELLRGKLLYVLQRQVSFISSAIVESGYVDTVFYLCILGLGLALLHSSGYLYWWLSPCDYFLLKFDSHNRRDDFDVQIIHWVRQSPVRRIILYMTGYFIVFMVSDTLLSCAFHYFSQQHRLLSSSPSQTFRMDLYDNTPVATSIHAFVCQRSCSEEIDRRQSAFNELLKVEREYTKRALDKSSYNMYWHIWTYSWGNVYDLDTEEYAMVDLGSTPLFDFTGEIFFAAFFFILGVGVLRWYGFVFWEKY
jgi:hypothetical protein